MVTSQVYSGSALFLLCSGDLQHSDAPEAISAAPDDVKAYTSQVLAVMCEAASSRGGVTALGKPQCYGLTVLA